MKFILSCIIFYLLTLFSDQHSSMLTNSSNSLIPLYLTTDLQKLTDFAKNIMNDLHIRQRNNQSADDSLQVLTSNIEKGYLALFVADNTIYPNGDLNSRYYIKPKIILSHQVDSVLKVDALKPTNSYIIAISSIIHELAHYLQSTIQEQQPIDTSSNSNVNNRRRYQKMPREFEAKSVGNYYILYFANRPRLKQIMDGDKSPTNKMKMILNATDSVLYPNSEPIFLEEDF